MQADQLKYAAKAAGYNARVGAAKVTPKVGDEIFEGTDYPRSWDEFIGQTKAIIQLKAATKSAWVREKRLDHILLATGLHGVGKSSLGKLIAFNMGVGLVELSGKISVDEVRPVLKAMEDNDILFIDEALAIDTPIPTPTGWTTMGEIKPDDEVLGADGRPTRVVQATEIAYDRPCYRVTMADGTSLIADAGHRWYAQPRVGTRYLKSRVVTTEQMFHDKDDRRRRSTGQRTWRLPTLRALDLPEEEFPVDPYVLGQWLGNGVTGHGHLIVRNNLLDRTILALYAGGERPSILDQKTSVVRIALRDTDFRARMKSINALHQKRLPEMYLRGSIKQRLALLQGLMDSDGYINDQSHAVFSNTNEQIVDSVMELLRSLGYSPVKTLTTDDRIGAKGTHQSCWKVSFRAVSEMMPFRLRDVEKVRPSDRTIGGRIVSIEPVESVPVRCIAVEADDHLFLAGPGMTVTHNCHQLVSGGATKAEWLLHLLQDGVLMTAKGPEPMPKVTVVAATTDVQKLPETIISRFMIKPTLEPYTDEEAAMIAEGMATKMGFDDELLVAPSKKTLLAIAQACSNSPRDIKALLSVLRDAAISDYARVTDDGTYQLETALNWAGVTYDGLTSQAQDYLCVLLTMFEGKAGKDAIAQALGEPGPVRHTEKLLAQKGLVRRTNTGRELTEEGVQRTIALLGERGLLEEKAA